MKTITKITSIFALAGILVLPSYVSAQTTKPDNSAVYSQILRGRHEVSTFEFNCPKSIIAV